VSQPRRSYYIDEAVRLYALKDYFMAHEVLEEHWAEAPTEDRDFLQGLIQLSVGLHHYQRGNLVGTLRQFRKSANRLSGYPDSYQGIYVASVRVFLDDALRRLEAGGIGEKLQPPSLA